jgi:hypothetical protein
MSYKKFLMLFSAAVALPQSECFIPNMYCMNDSNGQHELDFFDTVSYGIDFVYSRYGITDKLSYGSLDNKLSSDWSYLLDSFSNGLIREAFPCARIATDVCVSIFHLVAAICVVYKSFFGGGSFLSSEQCIDYISSLLDPSFDQGRPSQFDDLLFLVDRRVPMVVVSRNPQSHGQPLTLLQKVKLSNFDPKVAISSQATDFVKRLIHFVLLIHDGHPKYGDVVALLDDIVFSVSVSGVVDLSKLVELVKYCDAWLGWRVFCRVHIRFFHNLPEALAPLSSFVASFFKSLVKLNEVIPPMAGVLGPSIPPLLGLKSSSSSSQTPPVESVRPRI